MAERQAAVARRSGPWHRRTQAARRAGARKRLAGLSTGRALRQRIWMIALCAVAATVLTAGLILRAPRIYAATATLQVEGLAPRGGAAEGSEHRLAMILSSIVSPPVLDRVVEANGLRKFLVRPDSPVLSKEAARAALHRMVQVQPRPGTDLIEVRVEHPDPALTARLANSVVQEYLRDAAKEEAILAALSGAKSKSKLHQPAKVPGRPFSPDLKQRFTVGPLAGAVVGLLLALFLGYREGAARNARRKRGPTGRQDHGTTGRQDDGTTGRREEGRADSEKSTAKSAQSFPTARAAMGCLSRKETRQTVLFTSALAGEGKAACAVDYARSLAFEGHKTVLIDFDLANPGVDRLLNVQAAGREGMLNVLSGAHPLAEVIGGAGDDHLFYIGAGSGASDSAELLPSKFGPLLEELQRRFERVVINASPLFVGHDTLLLMAHIQTVCLVVRTRHTSRRIAARAIHALRKAGVPPRWLIFNRTGLTTVMPYHRAKG